MNSLDAFIGHEDVRTDTVNEETVGRWCATLDRTLPSDGSTAQGFHWCLGLPDAKTSELGQDGHPRLDVGAQGFLPPVPRRMWASSKLKFVMPLHIGDIVTCASRITAITEKTGRSGPLIFVDITHEIHGCAGLVLHEIQSVVYRAATLPSHPPAPPKRAPTRFDPSAYRTHRVITPTEPLLFRYSALTFNSHRIHYDRSYAADVEGFRGLVVQGPLTATLLLDLARRVYGDNRVRQFSFRGVSPAIAGEELHLALRDGQGDVELGAFAGDGRKVMDARAVL